MQKVETTPEPNPQGDPGRSATQAAGFTFMRSSTRRLTVSASLVCVALLMGGCETGRTTKVHADWQHVSDDTTTGKPQSQQALSPGSHQPPVPGSPTAAGPDGNQPADDMQARLRHGNEHGEATPPRSQPADSPERH